MFIIEIIFNMDTPMVRNHFHTRILVEFLGDTFGFGQFNFHLQLNYSFIVSQQLVLVTILFSITFFCSILSHS